MSFIYSCFWLDKWLKVNDKHGLVFVDLSCLWLFLIEVVVSGKGKSLDCFPFWRVIMTVFKRPWDGLQIYFALKESLIFSLSLDITDSWQESDLLFTFLQHVFFFLSLRWFSRMTYHWNSGNFSFDEKVSWDQGRISHQPRKKNRQLFVVSIYFQYIKISKFPALLNSSQYVKLQGSKLLWIYLQGCEMITSDAAAGR